MTEMQDKFNSLVTDVEVIKEKIEQVESSIAGLDKKISSSFKYIDKHIEHGEKWRGVVIGVAITIACNIAGFLYAYGKITERVEQNKFEVHCLAAEFKQKYERIYQHISADEARWNLWTIDTLKQTKGE